MKNDEFFDDFHIGRLIKKIADERNIASGKIAEAFEPVRYTNNADKIYKLRDMNVEDALRIADKLDYNLLGEISEKYLPYLQLSGHNINQEFDAIVLNLDTNRYEIHRRETKDALWENIHIGDYIKRIVKEKGLSATFFAKQLGCYNSLVYHYYNCKSMKIRKLIVLSKIIKHNLIAEVYLIQTRFFDATSYYSAYLIGLNERKNESGISNEGTFDLMHRTTKIIK